MSAVADTAKGKRRTYAGVVASQFFKRKRAVAALMFLLLLVLVAIGAPFLAGERPIYLQTQGKTYWFANVIKHKDLAGIDFSRWKPEPGDRIVRPPIPYTPERSNLRNRLAPPSREHLLGTDDRGRDCLARLIWGTRIAMSVGFVAEGIAVLIGVILGALAGYYRGKVDTVIMRFIEVMMCFPTFALILTLIALLPPSILNVMIVLGLTGWTGVARLVRGEFFKLREMDYAVAARASGLRDGWIMFRHLMPNALSPVLVSATFGVAGAILTESALSFLGFGVPPPTASWGELLSQSKSHLYQGVYWLVWFPGVQLFATVVAFNLVGEGLRDAMDPRMKE